MSKIETIVNNDKEFCELITTFPNTVKYPILVQINDCKKDIEEYKREFNE
jgi:hypothetical protein